MILNTKQVISACISSPILNIMAIRWDAKSENYIPYNGIFSRRQIFAVLFKKHGDYFSGILIFAVGNVRKKWFRFFSAKIIEWMAQLDFPTIDQLCGKKISGQSIKQTKRTYLHSDGWIKWMFRTKQWNVCLACLLRCVIRHFLPWNNSWCIHNVT